MAKQLSLRLASAVGFLALALFFVGIDPLLSIGAGSAGTSPAVSVDRSLKGDRLPISNRAIVDVPDGQAGFGARPSADPRAQIPFACDPAFSPIRAPASSNVYRRCLA